MKPPRISVIARTGIICAALLIGGCVRFGAKPPQELLAVAANSQVAPGTTLRSGAGSLAIRDIGVPRALDNQRVAVLTREGTYAYVAKANWVDSPRNIFHAVLAETVAARNGTLVLEPGQFAAGSSRQLSGELVMFGIDAAAMQAVVTFDATLAGGEREGVVQRRFTATAPVAEIQSGTVAPAIGAAANDVAVQVADWIKTDGQTGTSSAP